ncbi:MAG: HAD-IA family hydrolase [Thermoanaerobaculia bacterium]
MGRRRLAMAPAAIVFDLDGTLIDSRPDLTLAIQRMRAALGLSARSEVEVGGMIGEGARVLVERALAEAPAEISRPAALADFLAHYAEVCTRATRAYEGIAAVLDSASARWPLALLTNKPIAMTDRLIDHLGWRELFRLVVGGDSLAWRKPDPRTLAHVASELGFETGEVVLVGDSRIDAETAAAAGAGFIWVEWGYAGPEERRRLAGGNSARTPAELASLLAALPQ